MKKILLCIVSLMMLLSVSGCGSLSNLSAQDAYNIGYDIGYYGTKLLSN